ncbi:carbohydrate esterase family 16 protein [Laetiporus sulphureus 93-53]|uniref:Carbohydrate esterase family 16 protein n=1 Tax=Laetiporus sulphureus 93-53 TaxID=1314785 RepID=A0A165FWP8_9APHY|nr:carbohydrate esterase family 16 protein [Laetiporus sulphureus 93-53]KZT09511.1 carbohydrate esterase family 16 protein [Laetiporus sulphureus 93-53]
MSTAIQVERYWPGFSRVKNLVIFGDSYSAVGYNSDSPYPSTDNPLGVPFSGTITWTEPKTPNWVGHLITEHARGQLLVYDYAQGGDNVSGVRTKVYREFLKTVAKKPEWARWSEADSLFVTWVGINDCAFATERTVPKYVDSLFDLQEDLYNAGARNFLYIDVPPLHRSPAGKRPTSLDSAKMAPNERWNIELKRAAKDFASRHKDSTVLIYSSWDTFSRIMDDPVAFGFQPGDVRKRGSSMWVDRLHPTSKMHNVVARHLAEFLASVPPWTGTDELTEELTEEVNATKTTSNIPHSAQRNT